MVRYIIGGIIVLGVGAGALYALTYNPLPVEMTEVTQQTVREFIAEDAKTRLDDEYLIAMPISGTLLEPFVEIGDGHRHDQGFRIDSGGEAGCESAADEVGHGRREREPEDDATGKSLAGPSAVGHVGETDSYCLAEQEEQPTRAQYGKQPSDDRSPTDVRSRAVRRQRLGAGLVRVVVSGFFVFRHFRVQT